MKDFKDSDIQKLIVQAIHSDANKGLQKPDTEMIVSIDKSPPQLHFTKKSLRQSYLLRKIMWNDFIESSQNSAATSMPRDIEPERSTFKDELEELLRAVEGAVKARIKLGIDVEFGLMQQDLIPIIKHAKDQLKSYPVSLIEVNQRA